MNKEQARKLPRYIPNPLFKDLSPFVKNPQNFNKIQMILLNTLAGQHSHSEMTTWATCKTCQEKMAIHGETMRKLGFTSPKIYLSWKKVIEEMINHKRTPIR